MTQTSCLGSGLTQFEHKESTQQIADYKDMTEDFKDQLYNNRARTKDSKGNEQHVLVQVSARSTADRRSISRKSCHRKQHQPDGSTSSSTKHSELRSKMEGPREIRFEESESRQQTPTRCVKYSAERSEISSSLYLSPLRGQSPRGIEDVRTSRDAQGVS